MLNNSSKNKEWLVFSSKNEEWLIFSSKNEEWLILNEFTLVLIGVGNTNSALNKI